MTVKQLAAALSLTPQGRELDTAREVTGCYIGDLLSWVMGRAPADSAWITVMQNANVAAVALLADVACVILAEGVTPDAALLERAAEKEVQLYSSPLDAYALAVKINNLL